MGSPGLEAAASAALAPARRGAGLRDWWALEHSLRLRAWLQTPLGRAALVAVFALAGWSGGVSPAYVLAAAAFAYAPAWRGWVAWGSAGVALVRSTDHWLQLLAPLVLQLGLEHDAARAHMLAMLALYMGLAAWALWWTRRCPGWLPARRPVLVQLGLAGLLAALASWPAVQGGLRLSLWALLSVLGTHLWVMAYALQDQRSRAAGPLAVQMGLFHPFWRAGVGSLSPTPFGKGAAFLRRHQARDDQTLARTQIKGLKLMAWALVLTVVSRSLHQLAAVLGVPSTEIAYAAFRAGQPLPLHLNWASLVFAAAGAALALAILGHKIIAVARLAGFALPRNTWRPLQARTLADFWNRYYFYFKELLVDFFFFPTFLKVLRKHPRLRVFAATFMAAGVGNALYHFLRDVHVVAGMGWHDASVGYLGNLVYCTVLALGIGISQARLNAGRTLSDRWYARLWSWLCVWGFFVCLQVFGDESRTFALADRLAFFKGLFGG